MFISQNSKILSCKVFTLFTLFLYGTNVPFNLLNCYFLLWLIMDYVTRINNGSLYSGIVDVLLIFHEVLSSIKSREFLVQIGDY